MKKDVMLEITGIQKIDGESDKVELTTKGIFSKTHGNYYIKYDESELTGMENVTTVLKVEGNKRVTLTRSGNLRSQIIVEKGMRHQCLYDLGYASWVLGVLGDSIEHELDDNGGNLTFKYTLDVNTMVTSENEVRINIREAGIPNA
ncbi:MAG: DUF1934 domain-containing protein [Oscillospiraceae bacterium]|nr:DUF1934 domain-containing protein [Oscillospiraceae bacterium]MBQ3048439.1 DUF1934 domain-containing protein [Oscillospiraceae bacterium]MBQ9938094.1 DUF1934 domain-containing protein [Oscillospiraceae bacterium]